MKTLILLIVSVICVLSSCIAQVAENIYSISAWLSLIGIVTLIIATICFMRDE